MGANMNRKMYSYKMTYDSGFAPNPFHGWCTLATCKPRIRKSASVGDWIIGTGSVKLNTPNKLIYAMQVEEIISLDEYWNDPRFQSKKPVLNGSLKMMGGDNIYHNVNGVWIQSTSYHKGNDTKLNSEHLRKDTSVDRVLIGSRFVYYGEEYIEIPAEFKSEDDTYENLYNHARDYKNGYSPEFVERFEDWIKTQNRGGIQGFPMDWEKTRKYTVRS